MTERTRAVWRGTNLTHIADFNESVLLQAIRRSSRGRSRVALTQETGLSPQTISNICRRLIANGYIEEGERIATGFGKPRTLLTLRPDGQYAVGVHLDPLVMTFVILDLTGSVVVHEQHPTPTTVSPDAVLDGITRTISTLVEQAGIDTAKIAGIGFASPGPIDTEAGIILDPPHLPGWRNVALRDHLRDMTGKPVVLDKDVVAAAVGERWAGATSGYANSVFLYLSTGIGTGITVEDLVLRGFSSNAGDIGHLVVDPDGPPCTCGLRGCVGVTLSPAGIVGEALRAGVLQGGSDAAADPLRVDALFHELAALDAQDDPGARSVVDRAAIHLAKAASTIAIMVDTEIVAFGGPTWALLGNRFSQTVPGLVENALPRGDLGGLKVVGTSLGSDVAAIGAACLVLDQVFSPRPTSFAIRD